VTTALELARPTLERLHQRFGTPYLETVPYGELGTTRFLANSRRFWRSRKSASGIPRATPSWVVRAHRRRARALGQTRRDLRHAVGGGGIARALADELDMRIEFAGTFVTEEGDWLRSRVRIFAATCS